VKFFVSSASNPNYTSVIPHVDIDFVQPNHLGPIIGFPFLILLCPLQPLFLMFSHQVNDFTRFSAMKPSFMQNVPDYHCRNVWIDRFANFTERFATIGFCFVHDGMFGVLCDFLRATRSRASMSAACLSEFFHKVRSCLLVNVYIPGSLRYR
jgi:hypothetical protein